ncbi:NAD(P)H dehydrogenase [quinone] 1-like isoform X2 [Rana temporaria]|uniref:NAD(P)H dehydrogenase [quinone] 1-like isoform X2 n=1 Tax=Rana temporaria TaxID=8407 RepID=UPI001AADF9FE|nr:NAD(P)H dehydrogenase [quinone] 1-like isoform X2 [Rana temporaria]
MAGKTALIVLAHQERTSFNYAMKEAAVTVLKKEGWNVIESDLYAMQFNPVTSRDDITGNPKDPNHFKYGSETAKAWKEGRLTKDIVEEQKKIEMADLIIFQFPLYWFGTPAIMKGWFERVLCLDFAYNYKTLCSEGPFKNKKALLSFTTGSIQSMFSTSGIVGDINVILWPLQNGVLNSCGFKVLAPQISYSVAHVSQEVRVETLKSWEKRLETIWDEKPIKYLPVKDFEDFSGGFSLKKEVEESLSASKYAPTVGQNLGKPLPPDSQVKAEGSRLS